MGVLVYTYVLVGRPCSTTKNISGIYLRLIRQLVQKVGQLRIAIVKLVIAQIKGIKAHFVHHVDIWLVAKQPIKSRAGNGIAGMQLEDVGPRRLELSNELDETGISSVAHATGIVGDIGERRLGNDKGFFFQVRVVVVDVQHIQHKVAGMAVAVAVVVIIIDVIVVVVSVRGRLGNNCSYSSG